jgi:multiple sugar transport system substrate-binding protein
LARIRLDYWEKWSGREGEAMAQIVRSFNAAQQRYEVVMIDAGDQTASPDLPRFLNAQQRGIPPDVIGLEDHQISDLAARESLILLDEAIENARGICAEYHEPFLGLGKYNGKLYALPVSGDIVTLYINPGVLKGTRFETGRIPCGLWDFDAGLEEMRARGQVGFVPTYPGWWPQAWVWFFGGSWFDERGRFTPALPANIRAYEWISSFRRRWDLTAFARPLNPIGAQEADPFFKGEIAMVFEGDWLVRRLLQVRHLDWGAAPFPTVGQRPGALIVADVLGIPRGARHPEGAAEFISYAVQPQQIEQLALRQVKISPLQRWSETFVAHHENIKLPVLREILLTAELFYDPRVLGWTSYRERIKQAFDLIWSGKRTPGEALASIRDT